MYKMSTYVDTYTTEPKLGPCSECTNAEDCLPGWIQNPRTESACYVSTVQAATRLT